MEHASRRLIHITATAHPSAAWTLQQLHEAIPSDHAYRFIIHDHDAIFSAALDAGLDSLGLTVITTPMRQPQANAVCERLIGTLRRECLDWIIPINERHLQKIVTSWMAHYNQGRPHSALGPGLPEQGSEESPVRVGRPYPPPAYKVAARPILGGLHHEYRWQRVAA
jgi:putative transposase